VQHFPAAPAPGCLALPRMPSAQQGAPGPPRALWAACHPTPEPPTSWGTLAVSLLAWAPPPFYPTPPQP
jgi:hypothetical protein